jgi:hypothetical protein
MLGLVGIYARSIRVRDFVILDAKLDTPTSAFDCRDFTISECCLQNSTTRGSAQKSSSPLLRETNPQCPPCSGVTRVMNGLPTVPGLRSDATGTNGSSPDAMTIPKPGVHFEPAHGLTRHLCLRRRSQDALFRFRPWLNGAHLCSTVGVIKPYCFVARRYY